jgi:hypothetical protein
MSMTTLERAPSSRPLRALLMALTLTLALVSASGAAPAGAGEPPEPEEGSPEPECFAFSGFYPPGILEIVDPDVEFGPSDELVQGEGYLHIVAASLPVDCVEGASISALLESFSSLELSYRVLDDDSGDPIDLSLLFVGAASGATAETLTLDLPLEGVGCVPGFPLTVIAYCLRIVEPDEGGDPEEAFFAYARYQNVEVKRDAPLGAYFVEVTARGILIEAEPNGFAPAVNGDPAVVVLASSLTSIEVVLAAGGASGPGARVSCAPVPPVAGGVVTCSVSGPAGVDIWWTARASDAFAQGPVRIGSDGTGSFQFRVPVGVVGREVFVELVEWDRPVSLGVAGGPVPGRVPTGEGGGVEPLLLVSLLLAGAVGLRARSGRRARGVVAG